MNTDVIVLKLGGKVETLSPKYFTRCMADKIAKDTQYVLIPVGVYESQYLVFEPNELIKSFDHANISYKLTVVGSDVDMMCQVPTVKKSRSINVTCKNLIELYQFLHSIMKISTFNILYNGFLGKRYCGYDVYALVYDIEMHLYSNQSRSEMIITSENKKNNLTPSESFMKNFSKQLGYDVLALNKYSDSIHGVPKSFKCSFNLRDHTWTSQYIKSRDDVLVAVNLNLYNSVAFIYNEDLRRLQKLTKDKSIVASTEIIQYSITQNNIDGQTSTLDILERPDYFPLMHQASYMIFTPSDYIQTMVMLYHNFSIANLIKEILDESIEYDYNRIGLMIRKNDEVIVDHYIDSINEQHEDKMLNKFLNNIRNIIDV